MRPTDVTLAERRPPWLLHIGAEFVCEWKETARTPNFGYLQTLYNPDDGFGFQYPPKFRNYTPNGKPHCHPYFWMGFGGPNGRSGFQGDPNYGGLHIDVLDGAMDAFQDALQAGIASQPPDATVIGFVTVKRGDRVWLTMTTDFAEGVWEDNNYLLAGGTADEPGADADYTAADVPVGYTAGPVPAPTING